MPPGAAQAAGAPAEAQPSTRSPPLSATAVEPAGSGAAPPNSVAAAAADAEAAAAGTSDADADGPVHLLVLKHGLWGDETNLGELERLLREAFRDQGIKHVVLLNSISSKHHPGNFPSYDGLDVCGDRCGGLHGALHALLTRCTRCSRQRHSGCPAMRSRSPTHTLVHLPQHPRTRPHAHAPDARGAHAHARTRKPCTPTQCVAHTLASTRTRAHARRLAAEVVQQTMHTRTVRGTHPRTPTRAHARRLAAEIVQRVTELEARGRRVQRLSIVAYSIGGLVARCAPKCWC